MAAAVAATPKTAGKNESLTQTTLRTSQRERKYDGTGRRKRGISYSTKVAGTKNSLGKRNSHSHQEILWANGLFRW